MAPLPCIELDASQRAFLLQLARRSIARGLDTGVALEASPEDGHGIPAKAHGVFVTLTIHGKLRGCIGSMHGDVPLVQAVNEAACAAAFQDARFEPLRPSELADLVIEISVLSHPEPIAAASLDELLDSLEPGVDGLLLEEGRHRATFLPKVWEQLPEPADFVDHLLQKAALPGGYWSPALRCSRYHTTTFSEPGASGAFMAGNNEQGV